MGWFDEQIKQRKLNDDEVFAESFSKIGNAIFGRSVFESFDANADTKDAVEQILDYYGYKTNSELPDDLKGFNEQLDYLCRPHGLMFREIKLTSKWYKNAYGAILAIESNSKKPVALLPGVVAGYFYISDGKKVKVNKKTSLNFEEYAYCFYKSLPLRKINSFDLLKYALGTLQTKDWFYILSLMLVTTLIGLLSPEISYFLTSTVIEEKSISLLISTLILMFTINISSTLFSLVNQMSSERVNTKMSINVQAATMMRVLSLPASFFKKYASGDLQTRVGYVSSLANTLVSTILSTGLSSLFSLAYIGSIFAFAPSLVVPSLLITLATVTVSVISTLIMSKLSLKRMELSSKQSGMSYAMIVGMQKIKLSGSEKRAFARWGNLYADEAKYTYKPQYITLLSTIISLLGTELMYVIAVKSGVSVSEYYAFNAAYGMVSGAFSALASIVLTISSIKPTIEMAKPILDAEPEISEGKSIVTRIQGGVELNNISFRYDENMPMVINNMNLKIRPGEYVAIVGKTGCGKSTLIRLMLGFEKPQKGAIYFDGKDINTLDLKSLRRKIGVVMQEGKLFMGDIFSNITISAPWLTMDDAFAAADIAGIGDDIRNMPMGMNTLISEGSGGISGGQRQRIMIARAIAPKPRILIFDEATSALDNITQKKISEALDNLKCTRIVIAHRLSTIKHCDRILYLENGEILESGTYDELIELNGRFADLVERQRLDNN